MGVCVPRAMWERHRNIQPDLEWRTRSPFWDSIIFVLVSLLGNCITSVFVYWRGQIMWGLEFENVSLGYLSVLLVDINHDNSSKLGSSRELVRGNIKFVWYHLHTEITPKLLTPQSIKCSVYELKELCLWKYLIAVPGNINLNFSVSTKETDAQCVCTTPMYCCLVFPIYYSLLFLGINWNVNMWPIYTNL